MSDKALSYFVGLEKIIEDLDIICNRETLTEMDSADLDGNIELLEDLKRAIYEDALYDPISGDALAETGVF